jgi:hypothetical protein
MQNNEMKKALYKEKPIAKLVGREGDDYIYTATTTIGIAGFKIPADEMTNEAGQNIMGNNPKAQLLIRWLQ